MTAGIAATILTFFSLIQPCPAPPLVVGIVAGTAMGAGAATAGAYAAGHRLRRGVDAQGFDQCISQGIHSAQQVQQLANSSIVVSNLPAPCMTEIANYNAHPQIQDMNAVHGSTVQINSTSVLLENMPDYVVKAIQAAQANMQGKPAPSRRWNFDLGGKCEGSIGNGEIEGDCDGVILS